MASTHQIYFTDSRNLKPLADQSVQLVVTSPPYWQLKDYGSEQQIGFHDSYEDYINNLNLVWQECARVLEPGCRLCINIGDQFARAAWYGRYKVIPIRTEIIRFCETIGLDYMGAIIWQKKTNMNSSGGATIMGSFPYPRNGILKLDYEFILIFKKPGQTKAVSAERKAASKMSTEEWNTYFSGHWTFPGEKQKQHLATFPAELPRRLIKMFTFAGDTVLDPFLGSGTTSLAAIELERNSIGFEINREFEPLLREKLGGGQSELFSDAQVNFHYPPARAEKNRFEKLPYVFHDPVKVERKTGAAKKNFGAKVSKQSAKRETYYRVKSVLSGERLLLHDGQEVRLLGINLIGGKEEAARQWLQEKTKGQRVYLRSDVQTDTGYYIYLSNRTFLNAHLIRRGMAEVDTKLEFEKRALFEKYSKKRKTG